MPAIYTFMTETEGPKFVLQWLVEAVLRIISKVSLFEEGRVELHGKLLAWFRVDELSVVIAAMLTLHLIHLEFCAE
jgi:hypothetical protein